MGTTSGYGGASLDLLWGGECVGCRRPGVALCSVCEGCLCRLPQRAVPTPSPPGLPVTFAVTSYAGAARTVLLEHKERGRLCLAKPLGRALALSCLAVLAAAGVRLPGVTLVPVPSTRTAVRARGHDPLARIARECRSGVRRAGVTADVLPLLRVARAVADQAGLSADERSDNLSFAFETRRGHRAQGRSVVVLDDIITTGSTAAEASRALASAGATVLGVAVVAATQRRHS